MLSSISLQAAQRKLRQASTNVKHWNVQMNRLMHPIEPGGRRPSPGACNSVLLPVLLPRPPLWDPQRSTVTSGKETLCSFSFTTR